MAGLSHLVLYVCILGCIVCCSDAWNVQIPNHINALLGSCLVIPCSFNYYQYPPSRPDRVVWYQYAKSSYPLVYDSWYPGSVIDEFRGKTYVWSSKYHKTCSLRIEPVTWSHHRQKLYAWIDPENVGRSTYHFWDKTVTINVQYEPNQPQISIFGTMKVGQSVTVQCRISHTCSAKPPTMSLNIPLRNDHLDHTQQSDGVTTTTLTTTLLIERDRQTVTCSAKHSGGRTVTSSRTLNAECSISRPTISPSASEFLEGYAGKVSCTVSYTCPRDHPTLTWNYNSMPSSTDITKISAEAGFRAVSTLTLTASANDHGRSLACYAEFGGRQTQEARITLWVKRSIHSRGWSFTTPASITGMKGSCIIVPCRFSYSVSQPADLPVTWYLYQSGSYPAVFDQTRTNDVVGRFAGLTSLIGSVRDNNCSLKIEGLETSHSGDRLYPWIDKNPITSYHDLGHSFLDKTTQLIVKDQAEEPQMSVVGVLRVGEPGKVTCSVRHTCLSAPPTLSISGIPGTKKVLDTPVSDGIWERTVEQTWTVEEENQAVECAVLYPGGQRASSSLTLNEVECPYDKITMVEQPGEVKEGAAKTVVCTVSYKCRKNTPSIEWNYKNEQSSQYNTKVLASSYRSVSNLTIVGATSDDGRTLTCTARFPAGETSDSATIRIKSFTVLAADVPITFSALTRSCVVIPCSFHDDDAVPMTRGIWSKKTGGIIYHNGQSQVIDHFKGRTRMPGSLNEGNCNLEIDDIKPFDNGPFCFHAEKRDDKYRFNNSCVFLLMKASPDKPAMSPVPTEEVDAGSTVTVSCSVAHTCPSRPPLFSWSVSNLTSEESHTMTSQGLWETTSTVTFMALGGDGVHSLNCTATFWRGKQQTSTAILRVKGSLMYQMKRTAPVFIPVSLLVLIIFILSAVFGVCMWRKRKHADDSLKPPPRPEKRRSLWDRLSRRYPLEQDRPPRPEKRKSLWNRFTRRRPDDHVGWDNDKKTRMSFWSRFSRRPGNASDLSVGFINNTSTVVFDSDGSKPRCPSPKL